MYPIFKSLLAGFHDLKITFLYIYSVNSLSTCWFCTLSWPKSFQNNIRLPSSALPLQSAVYIYIYTIGDNLKNQTNNCLLEQSASQTADHTNYHHCPDTTPGFECDLANQK